MLAVLAAGSACAGDGGAPVGPDAASTADVSVDAGSDAARADARRIADTPLPVCDTIGEFPARSWASVTEFENVRGPLGLPKMYGEAVAWGDVNGDGRPDLYVPTYVTEATVPLTGDTVAPSSEVYVNCGNRFVAVGLDERTTGPRLERNRGYAAAIADLDADGFADLIAGIAGEIRVSFGGADGRFEAVVVWRAQDPPATRIPAMVRSLLVADLDVDGDLDLFAAVYPGANPLLVNAGGRAFEDRTDDFPELRAAGESETYSAALVGSLADPQRPWLYLANHDRDDRVFALGPGLRFEATEARPPWQTATMAVDYTYRDDGAGTIVATTDTARFPLYAWTGDALVDRTEDLQAAGVYNQWGVRFGDFDNDGDADLVYAPGIPDLDPEYAPSWGGSTYENHMMLFAASDGDDARWVDRSASAGPTFDKRMPTDLYAVATADFDRDGCLDLAVTPLRQTSPRRNIETMDVPIRVLRNRCGYDAHWVGLRVAHDPGAMAVFVLDPGNGATIRRYRDVPSAAGNGSASAFDELHVGLGTVDAVVSVEVRCRDGRQWRLAGEDLPVDRWHDRPDVCARGEVPQGSEAGGF